MANDKFLEPELDETKDFYCWRLHRKGFDKIAIIKALNSHIFFDSTPKVNGKEIYQAFVSKGLDFLASAESNHPSRTRYSFLVFISKCFHVSRDQSECWVKLYENTHRKDKTSWPTTKPPQPSS